MPVAHLDPRFRSPDAGPVAWETVRQHLAEAALFWVGTVRSDSRPHVTPMLAVVLDDVLHFCTGQTEQKAQNLAANPNCSLLTGNSTRLEGLDVAVEGSAAGVTDEALLPRLADEWVREYGEDWRFAVEPRSVFAFGTGEPYSQTCSTLPRCGEHGRFARGE